MVITKGFGKCPVTKGYGDINDYLLREILRLFSQIHKTMELNSWLTTST